MHLQANRLHLSPSDVTAFLACEHLTTLSLAHSRGELDKPEVENEQAELILRKGLEHERAFLESLRAQGNTVLEIPEPRGDYDGAARATANASRGLGRRHRSGVLTHDCWHGMLEGARRLRYCSKQQRSNENASLLCSSQKASFAG